MSFQGPHTQELGSSVLMVLLIMKYPKRSVKLPKWGFVSLVTIVKIGSFWVRYRAQQAVYAEFSKLWDCPPLLWIVSNISLQNVQYASWRQNPTLSTGVGWGVSSVKDERVVWHSQFHLIVGKWYSIFISRNACITEQRKIKPVCCELEIHFQGGIGGNCAKKDLVPLVQNGGWHYSVDNWRGF